jgi:hypothetical protein
VVDPMSPMLHQLRARADRPVEFRLDSAAVDVFGLALAPSFLRAICSNRPNMILRGQGGSLPCARKAGAFGLQNRDFVIQPAFVDVTIP